MALAEVLVRLGVDITEVGKNLDKVEKRFADLTKAGEQLNKVGRTMTKYVTLPLAGLGATAFMAATSVENAMNTIREGTGATGKALVSLGEDFRAVFRRVPQNAQETASAIADLNTRLGLTGEPLRQLALQMLELTDLTRAQVGPVIATTTRLFGDWGIATEDQAGALDLLWKVSQHTGVQVQRLSDTLVQFGAPLRMMGFSIEESAALVGKWEKEGVNMELVLGSLRIAMGHFAREGVPTRKGLDRTMRRMRQLGPSAEATALAMEVFGARAGPDMAAAILEGRFATEDLLAAIQASPETIMKAGEATENWMDQLRQLRNQATLAFEPIGVRLLQAVERLIPVFVWLVDKVAALTTAFSRLHPVVQTVALGAAGLLMVLGPALVIMAQVISALATIKKALILLQVVLVAVKLKMTALLALLGPKGWMILAGSVTIAVATFNRFRQVTASTTEALAEAVTAQSTLTQTGNEAAEGQETLTDALEEVGKAAGKNLMSFDQVHQLQEEMAGAEELAAKISPPIDLAAIKRAVDEIQVPKLDMEIIPVIDTVEAVSTWDRLTSIWDNFRARAAEIWRRIYSAVVDPIVEARGRLAYDWGRIRDTAIDIFTALRDWVAGMWERIRLAMAGPIERVREWLTTAWTMIRDTAVSVFSFLRDRITELWESIRLAVTGPIERAQTWLAGTWTTIRTTAETAFTALRVRVGELWEAVRLAVVTPIERVVKWLATTWTGIRTTAETAFTTLRDGVLGIWRGLESGIRGIVQGVLGPIDDIVKAVRRALDWLDRLAGRRTEVDTTPFPPPSPVTPPPVNGAAVNGGYAVSPTLSLAPAVKATAQAAQAAAAVVAQPLAQVAAQTTQAAAQTATTVAQAIVRPVQQAQRQVRQTANRIATAIVQPVQQVATRAAQAATTTAQAIVRPVQQAQVQIRRSTESIEANLARLDPTMKESPSLVDNVRTGVTAIQREYRQLERLRLPQVSRLGTGGPGATPGTQFGGDRADVIADAVGNAVLFAMREAGRGRDQDRQQEVVLEVDGVRLGRALLTGLRREEDRIGTRLVVT